MAIKSVEQLAKEVQAKLRQNIETSTTLTEDQKVRARAHIDTGELVDELEKLGLHDLARRLQDVRDVLFIHGRHNAVDLSAIAQE